MTRSEHLQWSKDRALEYVDRGDIKEAVASMASDLGKHDETANHLAIEMMMTMLLMGQLNSANQARKFIEGFN